MKEQLYTIPVNDAFDSPCECPVCKMYDTLEKEAIDFTMGPSYMEDDVRMVTNRVGFCDHHIRLLYQNQNRLGLALMLSTHMMQTNQDIERLLAHASKPKGKTLFSKKNTDKSEVVSYIQKLDHSCFVCDRIERIFSRYIATIFYCYEKDSDFPEKLRTSKGFCHRHFGILYEQAPNYLSGEVLDSFLSDIGKCYLENMKRVTKDLDWFTQKFDYKNENAPWKESKDALPRSMTKTNSQL
jgi:hypothetical protein